MQLIAIKKMGALGRVVVPADVRKTLMLECGVSLALYLDGSRIVLQQMSGKRSCVLCGGAAQKVIMGKYICDDCIRKIAKEKRWRKK